MSKKSRRARAKSRGVQIAPAVTSKQTQAVARPIGQAMAKQQPAVVGTSVVSATQYDYVKTDLIRIAIIAGTLLLILIILTFVPALKS